MASRSTGPPRTRRRVACGAATWADLCFGQLLRRWRPLARETRLRADCPGRKRYCGCGRIAQLAAPDPGRDADRLSVRLSGSGGCDRGIYPARTRRRQLSCEGVVDRRIDVRSVAETIVARGAGARAGRIAPARPDAFPGNGFAVRPVARSGAGCAIFAYAGLLDRAAGASGPRLAVLVVSAGGLDRISADI